MNFSTAIKPIVAALLFFTLASTGFADQSKELAAVSAAEKFLLYVDSGQYGESWEETSQLFKNQVSKQQWENQLGSARPAFGAVIKRELTSKTYMTSLPGAPDGEYVVIQFSTEFEHKKSAVETVTPMLESNGEWHVSGYYIR